LLCTAKPKEQKPNQTHHTVEDLFTESLASAQVQKTSKTKQMPHADANDDDIFVDMFSSSSQPKPNAGMSKPSVVTVGDDIFAAESAASAVKATRPAGQSKKASVVTNAFNIDDDDDDDDIFAIKPSSVSSTKTSAAATGNSSQKVCHFGWKTVLIVSSVC